MASNRFPHYWNPLQLSRLASLLFLVVFLVVRWCTTETAMGSRGLIITPSWDAPLYETNRFNQHHRIEEMQQPKSTQIPVESASETTAGASHYNSRRFIQNSAMLENPFLQYLVNVNPTNDSTDPGSIESQALKYLSTPDKRRPSHRRHNHRRFDTFRVFEGAACAKPVVIGLDTKASTGREYDETKIVCGLEPLQTEGCVIYAIGSNNEWRFEISAHGMTQCDIYSFDCTGPLSRFQVPQNYPRIHFYHWCLGSEYRSANPAAAHPGEDMAGGFSLVGETLTLSQIQQRLNHSTVSLYKMDIEGYEFPIIDSWFKEAQQSRAQHANWPLQILMEVHYQTQMRDLVPKEWFATSNDTRAMVRDWKADSIAMMRDWKSAEDLTAFNHQLLRLGYIVSIRDDNPHCRHCTELTLIRYSSSGFKL